VGHHEREIARAAGPAGSLSLEGLGGQGGGRSGLWCSVLGMARNNRRARWRGAGVRGARCRDHQIRQWRERCLRLSRRSGRWLLRAGLGRIDPGCYICDWLVWWLIGGDGW
jgi:hypothetical protein